MLRQHRTLCGICLVVLSLAAVSPARPQSQTVESPSYAGLPAASLSEFDANPAQPPIKTVRTAKASHHGIDWRELVRQSFLFMSVENAFRCATEAGTRDGFSNPFFRGYVNSVGNLHGWSDGDPFIVNYVGHPMQGAVSGNIWTHNDAAYRDIQFGQNRRYWKGKLRGAAYSYIYSVLFEIGPISEASIGNIQAKYPQQGFVDHIVTPVIGLGWSITEDALDQYLIRYLEAHTANSWYRLLVRSGLNPSRSMANVMAMKYPWHRDNRPGVRSDLLQYAEFMESLRVRNTFHKEVTPPPGVAPFEFSLTTNVKTYVGAAGAGQCVGGGGSAALRLSSEWQFVVDVSGCKLLGLETNLSGDSLSYLAGARWTPQTARRWTPHVELLVGGTKLTQELIDPGLEKELKAAAKPPINENELHSEYSKHWETNGFTLQAGGGLSVRLNSALSYRLADVKYSYSWTNEMTGLKYRSDLQFTTGLVLRMGTW